MAVNLSLELQRGPRAPHQARRAFEAACGHLDAGTRALVEHLADRWGTYRGSTHVWFEIELA